jgi:hypothetical protein
VAIADSTKHKSPSGSRILVLPRRPKTPLLDYLLEKSSPDKYVIYQFVDSVKDAKPCFKNLTYAEALRVQASLREWKTQQ